MRVDFLFFVLPYSSRSLHLTPSLPLFPFLPVAGNLGGFAGGWTRGREGGFLIADERVWVGDLCLVLSLRVHVFFVVFDSITVLMALIVAPDVSSISGEMKLRQSHATFAQIDA